MQKSKKLFAAALAVSALLGGVSVQAADLPNLKYQAVLQLVTEEGDQYGHTVIHTGKDNGKGYYTNDGTIQLQASSVQIGVGDDAASFNAEDVNNFHTFYTNFSDIDADALKDNTDLLAKYKAAGIVPGTVDKGTDGAVYGIAIGNYSHSASNGVAMGNKANAVTNGSVAVGASASAGIGSRNQATAIGYSANARAGGSVALGANSYVGDQEGNVVSVGKSGKDGFQRKIINVADGTKDTDAVNFKQLSDVDLVAQGAAEKVGTADFARTNYAAGATNATDAIYKVDTQVKTNTENIQTNTDMIGTADFIKTNYAAKTQNVTDALYAVDGQVKANADKLVAVETEAKKHTTLTEKTGNLNVVKTDKDGQANYDVSLSNHVTLSKDNNKVDLNGDEGTISATVVTGPFETGLLTKNMDFNKDGLTVANKAAGITADSTNINGGTITAKGTLDKTVNVLGKDYGIYDRTEISGGDITSTKESYAIKTSWGGFNGIEKETHKFDVSDKGVTFTKEESRIGLDGLKPVNETTTSSTNIDGSHITAGTVKINGESGSTMTGLTNTKWDAKGTYNAGRAATEEQLKGAYDDVSSKITETAATAKKHNTVKEGDNIELAEGINEDGGKEYTVSLAKDITVDSVTVNGEVKANSANLGGVEIGGGNINASTASIGNLGVTGNLSASTATITNLGVENNIYAKLGTIGGVGLENGNVTANSANIGGVELGSKDGISYVNANFIGAKGLAIGENYQDGNVPFYVNAGGHVKAYGADMSNQKITGVAAGEDETDAVNVKQLNDTVTTATEGSVKWDPGTTDTIHGVQFAGNGALNAANGKFSVAADGTVISRTGSSQLYVADEVASLSNGNGAVTVQNGTVQLSGGINGANTLTLNRDGVVLSGDNHTALKLSGVADAVLDEAEKGYDATAAVNVGTLKTAVSTMTGMDVNLGNVVQYDKQGNLHVTQGNNALGVDNYGARLVSTNEKNGVGNTATIETSNGSASMTVSTIKEDGTAVNHGVSVNADGSASLSGVSGNGFTANTNGTNTINGNTDINGSLNVNGNFSVNGKNIVTTDDLDKVSGTLNELDAYAGDKSKLNVTKADGTGTVNNLTDAVNANNDKIAANTSAIAATNKIVGDGKLTGVNEGKDLTAGINQNTADILQNQNAINSLGRSVNKLGGEIDSVGAISAALAGLHPIDYDPSDSKYQLSAALGSYDGSSAFALGGFYNFNKDVLLSLGVSSALKGERKTAGNLGVTFRIGSGAEKKAVPEADKDILTRIAELAQKVSVLEQKNDKLEKENADQKKQIEVLQAKTF